MLVIITLLVSLLLIYNSSIVECKIIIFLEYYWLIIFLNIISTLLIAYSYI